MLNNKTITYYHKTINPETKLEEYTKTIFENIWLFSSYSSNTMNGYTKLKSVNVRIPFEKVNDVSLFSIGDIIAVGKQDDITKQTDLNGKEFYNVTSININNFGNTPHIHLGGQ